MSSGIRTHSTSSMHAFRVEAVDTFFLMEKVVGLSSTLKKTLELYALFYF